MRIGKCLVPAVLVLAGCGRESPTQAQQPRPAASSDPSALDVGSAVGPSLISFVSGDPSPGSDVPGCGPDVSGCRGKVRLRFAIQSPATGESLGLIVFLHSTEKRACLSGLSGPFLVEAGKPSTVDVVLDRADDCRTPVTISHMAAVLEGTVEIASRQEWGLHYSLSP